MEKNKRYNSSILISFLVSAYALTVLAHILIALGIVLKNEPNYLW